ncbi:MAG: winged helix DNA-binding domain-containing protein [Nocardioidaceae bacterium]
MTDVLDRRRLNRATLARQHLLERADQPLPEMVEHLGGMQSQAALAPYVGLWTRLRGFDPNELSDLIEVRALVRLHLMRNTVHLASARDALGWRPLFSELHAAEYRAHFPRAVDHVDLSAVLAFARELLEEEPRTRAELGRRLAEQWPEADPSALSYAVTHHLALCQTPPRGLWGRGGPAAWTPLDSWLGASLSVAPVEDLVLRYFGAFGPATIADVQRWSGLTRLGEVVERLSLRRFRGEDGQTLHDHPDAARPDPDVPAPPRFLPAYDNLLLSHKDRGRFIPHDRAVPLPPGNGADVGTVLVDGSWQGTWRAQDGTLRVELFGRLDSAGRSAMLAEGARLGSLLRPDSGHDVDIVVT